MLAELRKYGIGLVLANQLLDQIDAEVRSAILGNVGTLILFRVGADAQKIVKEIFPNLDFYELTLLRNRMFWIRPLVRGESKKAFTGETITLAEPSEKVAQWHTLPALLPKENGGFRPEDLGE